MLTPDSTAIDWNTTNTSALIPLSTYSLSISTFGLARTHPSQPITILISGTGCRAARWSALIRALSPFTRILSYDRCGFGLSEPRPNNDPPTLFSIGYDLYDLLQATRLAPPYILVAHSWGGMLAVNFASLFPPPISAAIKGLILLDAGAPTASAAPGTHQDFTTDPGSPWSHHCVSAVTKGFDVRTLMNLTCPPDRTALTAEEYEDLITSASTPAHQNASRLEFAALQASYSPFWRKFQDSFLPGPGSGNFPLLSSIPICLIHAEAYRSFQRIYDLGTSAEYNNGTPQEREEYQALLKTWRERVLESQKQFLILTDGENGKSMFAKEGTGHDVMMEDVETVVEGWKWVAERVR